MVAAATDKKKKTLVLALVSCLMLLSRKQNSSNTWARQWRCGLSQRGGGEERGSDERVDEEGEAWSYYNMSCFAPDHVS